MKYPALWAALAVTFAASAWSQQDPCATFTWDISHERALFAAPAVQISAGAQAADAPAITPERLLRLQLQPREHVSFALPPDKQRPGDFAGLVRLQVASAGNLPAHQDLLLQLSGATDARLRLTVTHVVKE